MKTTNNSLLRTVCAIVLGVLLVAWPEAALYYLVIIIGMLFLVPGASLTFGYMQRKNK